MESVIKAIEIYPDRVRLLDQRKLPLVEEYVDCHTSQEVAVALKEMVVRGAPAIGVAAAAGIALGVQQLRPEDDEDFDGRFAAMGHRPYACLCPTVLAGTAGATSAGGLRRGATSSAGRY